MQPDANNNYPDANNNYPVANNNYPTANNNYLDANNKYSEANNYLNSLKKYAITDQTKGYLSEAKALNYRPARDVMRRAMRSARILVVVDRL